MNPLKYVTLWLVVGYIMLLSVIILSLIPKPPQIMEFTAGDKVKHIIAYFSLMFWFGQIYIQRNQHLSLILLFCTLGVIIEILQGLGGVRFFEYADMLANATGVILGWWLTRFAGKGVFVAIEARLLPSD